MNCKKCKVRLILYKPTHTMIHCGTDYWTKYGERLWKPTVCAVCKRKNGQHAKAEQDKQIRESETRKHAKHLENVLNNLLR